MLTAFTRVASHVAADWLACIAINILTSGRHLDVAARDLVIALAAYTLARLEEVRVREQPDRSLRLAPARETA